MGKSKIFNCLSGKNLSIVFEGEDTTVDYVSLTVNDQIIVDTAGVKSLKDIKKFGEDDLYLYVVKLSDYIDDKDKYLIYQMRKKNIYLIVNGIDRRIDINYKMYESLGCQRIYYISAEHNINIDELKKDLNLEHKPIFHPTVAILGRCNSGKSTLMNALLRQDRMIVSTKIGTTRDTVRETVSIKDQSFDFMDTAGYRNNSNILEHITAQRRLNCLKHCQGSIVVIDGKEGFTNTDKVIFNEALKYTNFIIIAINKEDIMERDVDLRTVPQWVPVIYISALNNRLLNLRNLILQAYGCSRLKFTTNKLNRWLQKEEFDLRSITNKSINLKYITQFACEPLTIGTDKPLSNSSQRQFIKKFTSNFEIIGAKVIIESMN